MSSNYPSLTIFDPSMAPPGMDYCAVWVQDIPWLFESELDFIFREYGVIASIRLLYSAEPQRHSAIITYDTARAARNAVREAHGLRVNRGPSIHVSYSSLRPDVPTSAPCVTKIGSGNRGVVVTGPKAGMDRMLIHEFFCQFGAIDDVDAELVGDGGSESSARANVVFETEQEAVIALDFTRTHRATTVYQIVKGMPLDRLNDYYNQINRTIYVGNMPISVTDSQMSQSLAQYGFVSKYMRLTDGDDISYFKVRFGNPAEAAMAVQSINSGGLQCYRQAKAGTTLVSLHQTLPRNNLGPRRRDRRPGAPARIDPVIIRHPGSQKFIRISGLNITSAGAEQLVYNAIRFYDDPGTNYGFVRIRFSARGRDAIIACKTNACAILNMDRMANENFFGPTSVVLTLMN